MVQEKIQNENQDKILKKVLIVDDKSVNRYTLKGIFEDDYEVLECSNGAEAIEALSKGTSEMAVVLLDIIMPDCDGFSVLEYMKENNLQDIPVVLVSANVSGENIRKASIYEVADYIQKPFEDEVVRKRVEHVMKMFEKRRKIY